MFNFSIWKLNGVNNIEDAQLRIELNKNREENIGWEDEPLKILFKESSSGEIFNNIKSLSIESNPIKYISFGSVVEKLKYAKDPNRWFLNDNNTLKAREDRVRVLNSDVLLFEIDNQIYGILFSGVTVAKQIIVKAFPIDIWGKVTMVNLHLNEDILFWMFKTFIDFESKELSKENPIRITAIRSYLAKTRDEINTLRGKGEKISAILGTLAFLFKNDKLKSIMPELQYKGQVFVVEISLNGTFKTDEAEYDGVFLELDKSSKKVAIVIYLSMVLLPKLVEAYKENIQSNKWSKDLKIDFIERLGMMIKESVDIELENMKNIKTIEMNLIEENEENDLDSEIEEIDEEINELDEI